MALRGRIGGGSPPGNVKKQTLQSVFLREKRDLRSGFLLLVEEENVALRAFEFKWGGKVPFIPTAFREAYQGAVFQVVNRANYLDFV